MYMAVGGVIESAIERYLCNTIAGKGQSKVKKIENAKKDNKFMSVKELDSIVASMSQIILMLHILMMTIMQLRFSVDRVCLAILIKCRSC